MEEKLPNLFQIIFERFKKFFLKLKVKNKNYKPYYAYSEPEFFGKIPVRTELTTLQQDENYKSLAQEEFEKFGGIAIRRIVSINNKENNTVDLSWEFTEGDQVLIRAKTGGFYIATLHNLDNFWFAEYSKTMVPIIYCKIRKLYIVRHLI